MQRCWDRYVRGTELENQEKLVVLDVGAADINGSYRPIFNASNVEYLAADLEPGPNVSVTMTDPYKIPLDDASVDLVISGQMLEHCEFFWLSFSEMMRVLKPDGYLFLIAPSSGGIHRYPVDCYRFHPDAYHALAKYARCKLVDVWHDKRGSWRDLVGVFSWRPDREARLAVHLDSLPGPPEPENEIPEQEVAAGQVRYRQVLKQAHAYLKPELYLEIGVNTGASIALAKGPAVGVDPRPNVTRELPDAVKLVEIQSDDFFEKVAEKLLQPQPELIFIDGMHLFEFALRDFINAEAVAAPNAVIVIDDIFPNHPAQATRDRTTRHWTGDIWKLHDLLKKERPDLFLMPIDTAPTGLLLVWGLNPANRRLWERYDKYIRTYVFDDPALPAEVLERVDAVAPDRVPKVLKSIAATKGKRFSRGKMVARLRKLAGIESEG
jgi:SAM-dependent methyltransferase